jgi:uncharacterized RDD family membrane protein YckC
MEKEFNVDQLAKPELRLANFIIDTSIISGIYIYLNSNYQITQEPGLSRTNVLGLIVFIIYYSLCEWLFGKTMGKFITKTSVLNDNGTKLNFSRALIKSVMRLIPLVQWTYVGKISHGWPDRFTNTMVIPDTEINKENQIIEDL